MFPLINSFKGANLSLCTSELDDLWCNSWHKIWRLNNGSAPIYLFKLKKTYRNTRLMSVAREEIYICICTLDVGEPD